MTRARDLADSADKDIAGTLTLDAVNASGVITGLTVEATGDTAAGDNAALGYTAAEGLVLTGQGSTGDITIKNDADAVVLQVPTGTTNVNVIGSLDVATNAVIDGTALVTGVLTTTAATVFNGGFAAGGVGTFANGSTSAPSITNTGDLDTGISFPAANSIAFSTAGTQRTLINADGFYDYAGAANDVARFSGPNSGSITIRNDTANQLILHTGTSDSLVFGTGGNNDRLTIDALGNVAMFGDGGVQAIDHYTNYTTLTLSNSTGAIIQFEDDGNMIGELFTGTDHFTVGAAESGASLRLRSANGSEYGRINGNSQFSIGAATPIGVASSGIAKIAVASANTIGLSLANFANNGGGSVLTMGHSRSTTTGTAGAVVNNGDSLGMIRFAGDDGTDMQTQGALINCSVNGSASGNVMPAQLEFHTNAGAASATRRLTLGAQGPIAVGASGNFDISGTDTGGLSINANDGFQMIDSRCTTTSNTFRQRFFNGTGDAAVGAIRTNGSSTIYDTSSDYRLKENVVYDWDATTRLKQLKPCRFNFINDDTNTAIEGFLAHEAATVVPNAVGGEKDATEEWANCVLNAEGQTVKRDVLEADWIAGKSSTTDADGNTVAAKYASNTTWTATHHTKVMQSIDHSWLVPLLCKTIQELEARITSLEG